MVVYYFIHHHSLYCFVYDVIWVECCSVCCCVVQVKRASLVDSRTAVNDAKFSPRHLGLQLVCLHMYTQAHTHTHTHTL